MMHEKKEFDDFLRAKKCQAKSATGHNDWQKQKNEWLKSLTKLYGTFKSALAEYTTGGDITLRSETTDITEEYIGKYEAPMMVIVIADREEVTLRPIGTNLIAAKGRVDMEGAHGRASLVLVDSNLKRPGDSIRVTIGEPNNPPREDEVQMPGKVKWEWKFVTGPPYREFIPVVKETILTMLMRVSDGK